MTNATEKPGASFIISLDSLLRNMEKLSASTERKTGEMNARKASRTREKNAREKFLRGERGGPHTVLERNVLKNVPPPSARMKYKISLLYNADIVKRGGKIKTSRQSEPKRVAESRGIASSGRVNNRPTYPRHLTHLASRVADAREAGDPEGRLPTSRRKRTRFMQRGGSGGAHDNRHGATARVRGTRVHGSPSPKGAKSERLDSLVTRRGLSCVAGTGTGAGAGVGGHPIVGACALRAKSNVALAPTRSRYGAGEKRPILPRRRR